MAFGKDVAIDAAANRLRAAGIDQPFREARLLAADPALFAARLERRLAREPMAYILGTAGFWTLDLAVDAATLIPRPDSETLIEAALVAFSDRAAVRSILDLGTGTGCLLLASLTEFPTAWGLGIDRAPAACRLAATNATTNGLARRCLIVCADWVTPLAARFDLILSNPPYIPSADLPGLMPEVSRYEPRLALDGGPDGLAAYRILFASLASRLTDQGVAILELGAGQAPQVVAMAVQAGWQAALRDDLAGHARALTLRRWPTQKKSFGVPPPPG